MQNLSNLNCESDLLNSSKTGSSENNSRKVRSQSCSAPNSGAPTNCSKIPKWSINSKINLINLDDFDSRTRVKSPVTIPRRSKSHSSQNVDQSKSRHLSKYLSKQRKSIAAIGSDFLGEHNIESARNFLKLSKIGMSASRKSADLHEKEEHYKLPKKLSLDFLEDSIDLSDTCSSSSSSSANKARCRGSSSRSENRDSLPDITTINIGEYKLQKEIEQNENKSIGERLKYIKSDERGVLLLRRYDAASTKLSCIKNDIHKSSLSHFQSFDHVCKVVLLGDSGVGKTCLLMKFQDGVFLSGSYISTVGIDFRNKVINIDDCKVKLQIWDTAGQERFRSVTHAYYRDAHALLLLYDVTSKASFDNTREWLAEVHEYAQDDVVIMLIGNKCDVPLSERYIRREDGEKLAREYNVAFMETSAKTGLNVDLAFTAVARDLKERKSSNILGTRFNVSEYIEKQEKIDHCLCSLS